MGRSPPRDPARGPGPERLFQLRLSQVLHLMQALDAETGIAKRVLYQAMS